MTRLPAKLATLIVLAAFCVGMVSWGTRHWSRDSAIYGSPDMDAWLRLTIVTQLHDTGDWFNHKIDRYGVPDALETPWTRPLDVLLLAGALPLSAFMPFKEALLLWAIWINPVLFSLALVLVASIGRRLNLSPLSIAGAALLFIFSPFVMDTFAVGRTDHHSLLALTFLAWIRCLLAPARERMAAGVVLAFGIWVSPEFLVAGLAGLLWLYGSWLLRGGKETLNAIAGIFGIAVLTAVAFLTLEHGFSGWGVIAYDSLSPVHIVALATGLAWGRGMLLLNPPSVRARLFASLAAVPLAAMLIAVFPGLLRGPVSEADALAWWHTRTYTPEAAPLRQLGLSPFVLFAASCAMAAAGWLAVMKHSACRANWLLVGAMTVTFSALTFAMLRWCAYASPMVALCIAGGLEACRRISARAIIGNAAASLALILALLAGTAAVHVWAPTQPPNDKRIRQAVCRKEAFRVILRNDFPQSAEPHVILALPFMLSTHIPFWTPHASALTWDYHRRADGLLDLSAVTYARDGEEARAVLRRHRVTLLLACDSILVPYADQARAKTAPPHPFLDSLFNGGHPSWMTLLPRTQAQEAAGYYLFEIKEP